MEQKKTFEERFGWGERVSILPTDGAQRKTYPITTGVLDYFPDAIAAVAHLSYVGNQQHNPGQPLHWAREKSTDHADTLARHLIQRGTLDIDGVRHSAKVAWRALALLQTEIEQETQYVSPGDLTPATGIDPVRPIENSASHCGFPPAGTSAGSVAPGGMETLPADGYRRG